MSKFRLTSALLVGLLFLVGEPAKAQPAATIVTVGSDAACDYSSLTAATFANGSIPLIEVHVAKNVAPSLDFLPGRNMFIVGGYDTCSDSSPSGRTILNGTGGSGSVLLLSASYSDSTSYTVTLNDLQVSGGLGSGTPQRGGGITVAGPFSVFMIDTVVRDNSALRGGGIYIKGQAGNAGGNELTQVVLSGNSYVGNNTADSGAGIACEEKANVRVYDAAISNNQASEVGGGIYSLGCHTTVYDSPIGRFQGVLFNTASGILTAGGGIYADASTVFLRGGSAGRARVGGNQADLGGGIYLRNNSQLYAYDANITFNMAFVGGGVYAENSTTVISRTRGSSECHDPLRCSVLSDNRATAPSSNAGAGGGALFADGGTTRISGTFMERNRADGGRGMAVRVVDAPGTRTGFDQNGLRILGSVLAKNTNGGGIITETASIVEMRDSSGAVGFSTFSGNRSTFNLIYTPATGTAYGIDVFGSIFDASSGNVAGPGDSGVIPNGDCNRLHETSSAFAMNSMRSNIFIPEFVDAANDDYRLGGLNMVDWCDASENLLGGTLSADGGPRPVDDPGIAAKFGNYDLGGLERQPASGSTLPFRDGFE